MTTLLFDRLGGTTGISTIVDQVVEAHLSNPAISARFLPYMEQPDKLAVIRQNTIDFFSAGSGGQVAYSGKDMPTAHRGMNIRPEEFMHAADDILKVLDKNNIDDASKAEVLYILWTLKDSVIAQ